MKQLAQYQDGRLELQEVPIPAIPPGGILVRTLASVISPGTEKMKVEQAKMNLLQKARARPDQVRKVLATAKTLGWRAALEKVRNRLESPTPLGYSAAGIVEAVDPLNTRFRCGDLVACGGAECAHHAEFIAVPDLLAAPVPEGVEPWQAAYTTLASISMQAVRQADAKLGERVLVIGQGLVGQLATSLLRASGVRVMAADLSGDRLRIATQMGAERAVHSGQTRLPEATHEWTDGCGVDAILLCIGGSAPEITRDVISALRDRGTLVIVGIFNAQLEWKDAYMKDIQVRYSRSYGPGRYDPSYEFGGIDYPIGHVRWTENRNFDACLHLMQSGALDLRPVTTRRAPFIDALAVYDQLLQPDNADIGVVLESSSGILPESSGSGILPESSGSGILPESSDPSILLGQTEASKMLAPPATGTMPVPPPTGTMPVPPLAEDRRFIPYDPNQKTTKSQRNLPHWEQEGVTQFVTFRQADSLPQAKLNQWRDERDQWLALNPRPWDAETEETYHRCFQDRLETWLDDGHGSCLLARPEAAAIVEGALRHFDGQRYILDEFVLMPNHVHVLVKPLAGHTLGSILHSWKSFTGREIKKQLQLDYESLWQDERFDHALRSEAALRAKRTYIRRNPQHARLTCGFVLGSGLGLTTRSSGILPETSGSGILPESSGSGILPESSDPSILLGQTEASKMLAPPATGTMPVPQATGSMPVPPAKVPVLHVLGAGNFARTMLLPHLKDQVPFGTIINATGLSARHVQQKFGFQNAATDPDAAFASPDAAVLIATRHHLHAPLLLRALDNHQHAFVEKPLCLTPTELTQIDAAIASSQGSVMVGFNRRFAPATVELRRVLAGIHGPKSLAFHVNAGPLAPDHWYANLEESGGRILGEACHFIDFACAVLGSKPTRVTAQTTTPPRGARPYPDSIAAQIEFADGSTFQLIYTAEGDAAFPKEHFRLFAPGLVAEGENFQTLRFHQNNRTKKLSFTSKGHAEEMAAWSAFLKGNAPHPLPYPDARTSTLTTFALLESIQKNAPISMLDQFEA